MNTAKTWLKKAIVFLVVAAMAIALFPFVGLKTVTKAADPVYPVPETSKQLIDNEDGTYTLKLSVKGSAKTETENPKVNVVFIMDRSGSMQNQQAYTGQSGYAVAQYGRYGHVGTAYPQLYYRNTNGTYDAVGNNDNHATVYTRSGTAGNYTYTQYNNTRFNQVNNMRRDQVAIAAASDLADSLLSYNTAANPDIVEMAFVSFNDMATNGNNGNWTTSASTARTVIRGYTGQNNTGTNWEDALIHAKALADNKADDEDQEGEQMFIIFLTDGNPTRYVNNQGQQAGDGQESESTINTCYNQAAPRALELTNAGYELYNIGVFGSVTRMENLTTYANTATAEGHGTATYYAAANASALEAAFAEILRSITDTLSLADVKFTDGVTDMTHSTGVNGMPGNFQYTMTVNGVEEPWVDAPEATVNANKEVIWDLSKDKEGKDLIIADGVTVTCSFLVWPDQDAMDLIADLNNNKVTYDSLTPAQKAQIIGTTPGNYALKTNTQAKLDYSILEDRDGAVHKIPQEPITLTPPDPMPMFIDKLSLEKKWDDSLDPDQREEVQGKVTLDFYKDNTKYILPGYEDGITLTEAENWIKTDFLSIATGIMVSEESPAYDASHYPVVTYDGKTYCILETGHDYHFQEQNINDHYELTAYTYHPMLVDGVLHNLFFEKDADDNITVTEGTEISTVSATNTIKGGVSITKKVVDENGNEVDSDDPFTMTMHMVTPEGEPYSYDYRIYYGQKNPRYNDPEEDASATDIQRHRSPHRYGEGEATITIYVGDEIRFVNVDDDTRYYVEEADPLGYELQGITYKIRYGDDPTLVDFTDDQKVTIDGKTYYIMEGNSSAAAVVTNIFKKGDLEVTKTVVVPEGITKDTNQKFEFTFKLYDRAPSAGESAELTGTEFDYTITAADGTKTTGTIAEGGTFELKDGEKIKIEGLPDKSYYEVTETHVSGYSTTSTNATGTIAVNETATAAFTNTLNPATVSFPVVKELIVPAGLEGPEEWEYTITVAANDGAPTATTMSGKVDQDNETVTFGPFTYTEPDTYTYTVTETGTVAGVINDSAATTGKIVTVTVVDEGDGILKATASSTTAEPLKFTNRYNVRPTTVEFPVEKELVVPDGLEGPEEWEYTINVAANNGAPVATTMSGKVDQDNETVTFGPFAYTAPGTYTYTVTETGTVAGVTNDAEATTGKTVTVTVVDNGDGTLTATASSTEASPLKFTNRYNVGPTTVNFPVVKELVVPEGLEGPEEWEYTINVAANNGAPVATTMSGKVDQDNDSVSFGPFTYTAPGTYTYTVSETGTIAGVTNDAEADGKTVTVTVVDNGDGTLTATADSTEASPLKFTNTYNVGEVKATFPVKKELVVPAGLDGPEEWEYTITVAAVDGAPVAATMSGTINQDTPDATLSFGQFTYTAPGTYTYTVTETGTVKGVTNDSAATTGKTVTVTVTDDGEGKLTAVVSSTVAKPLTFTNTYIVEPTTVEFPVEKELVVPEGLTGPTEWSYTIDVEAEDGAPEAETMTGTVDQDNESVTFGPFTYTTVGEYTYTVTETGTVKGVTNDSAATTGKTVTVTVVDNGDGTLTATADSTTASPLTFTNTYNVGPTPVYFPVEKELVVPEGLEGPEEWEYTINVAANGNAPAAATMTGKVDQDNESVTFGPFVFTAPGTYTYKVTETGTVKGVTNDAEATSGKTVTVTVVDNGDGTMTATADSTTDEPLKFTNTYNVGEIEKSFPVKKELVVPAGMTGPTQWSYTIDVAANGNAPVATTMTGTINQDTANKTITFGPFKFTAPGTYTYKVTETGTVAGVTNDAAATTGKTVTVTVEDDGQGGLTAEVSSTEASPLTFTNTYNVGPTVAKIPVKKNVTSASGLTPASIEGKFTFTLAPVEGAPMPAEGTAADGTYQIVSGASGATVEFPEISYTAPGTYKYTIKESVTGNPDATSVDGIDLETLDPKEISVVVTDKGDGTLEAVVNGKAVLEFNNPYRVTSIDIIIPVEKILSVPDGLTAPDITEEYTFELKAVTEGAPMPTKTSQLKNPSKDGGNMTFGDETTTGKITISAPGEYQYTITETGEVDGVKNDAEGTKNVKVTVTDNGDGTLSYTLDSEKVSFTNTYNVEPITAKIPVEKILEVGEGLSAPDITEEFTFTLTAGTNTAAGGIATPMPEVTEYTNPDADGGDMSFGDITYTEPGTYTYTVTETGEVDGVSAVGGVTVQTVTVVVVDNSDGTMTATVNGGETVTFINEYKVGEATAVIPVTKILNVAEGLDPNSIANMFTFTLTAGTNTAAGDIATPMPQTTSFTNPSADGGTVTFGGTDDPITFTAPGTYTYTVTETGSAPGVINDATATKDVTVVVTDNGDGTMTAVTNEGKALEFTNTYDVEPTEVSFPVKKILSKPDDATGPAEWRYTIDVAANNGAPVAETMTGTVSNTADTATFGPFKYYAPGTFTYTVTETGEIKGVTNDPAAAGKTVTVSVVDNGDGTMTATADSKVDAPLTFTNSYSYENITATPAVHKTLSYEDGLTPPDITEKYTFKLEAVTEGAPMPAADTEVKNPAADGGTKSFGTITFTRPGTYEYKVTETGTVAGVKNDAEAATGKKFKIIVTDNSEGKLVATIDYGTDEGHVTFVNTYEVEPTTISFPVEKVLEEDEESDLTPLDITGKFTFDLAAVTAGAPMPAVTSQKNPDPDGGTVTFGDIEFKKPGTYEYKVTETGEVAFVDNDPDAVNGKTVTVTVTDNSDGTMTATSETTENNPIVFTNTRQQVSATVIKVWDDFDDRYGKRPESLDVDLLADGVKKDTVTLNEGNQWTATVKDLPKYDAEGKEIKYTWAEGKLPAGYELTNTETEGRVTTLTNSRRYGDLVIRKDLTKYNNFINEHVDPQVDQATFIFHITAKKGDTTVYEDYVGLTFNGDEMTNKVEIRGMIPVGAVVTVVEDYDGAGYVIEGQSTKTVTITDPTDAEAEVAEADFTNAYDDKIPGGYGIVNHYTKDNDGNWNGENIGDNRVPAPILQ